MSKKSVFIGLSLCLLAVVGLASAGLSGDPSIPKVTVKVGMAPMGDQSWAVIGMQKGWFAESGITVSPEPYGSIVTSEQRTAALIAGMVDIMTGHPGSLVPVLKAAPNLRFFMGSNIFEGYAILARPDGNYTSYQEFLAQGKNPQEALKLTMGQLRGKRYCYSAGSATMSFVNSSLALGGMSLSDTESLPLDDPECVATMTSGRADFSTTAAAQRVALEARGFKAIFTIADVASLAKPSPASNELQGVLVCGWCTTDEYLKANHDTILRLSGVLYRTLDFMVKHQDEAIKIQAPFYSSIAGLTMGEKEWKLLYTSLNPFYNFDMQAAWYENPDNIYYYKNELGAKIRSYVENGVFKPGEINEESVSVAPALYKEMKQLRADAQKLIAEVKAAPKLSDASKALVDKAEYWLAAFNFLDAKRFAQAAKDSL